MILKLTLNDLFHTDLTNPVSVNFDNVTYWQRNYTNCGTDIFFVDGLRILVKEEKETIDQILGL